MAPGPEELMTQRFEWAMQTFAVRLLDEVARECPGLVPRAVEAIKHDIQAEFPDDEQARFDARLGVCVAVMRAAPSYGLQEFEDIEGDLDRLAPTFGFGLRMLAAAEYGREGRAEAAKRQWIKVAEDEAASAKARAMGYTFAVMAGERGDRARGFLDKAEALFRDAGAEPPMEYAIARLAISDPGPMKAIVLAGPVAGKRRTWACTTMMFLSGLLRIEAVTRPQADGLASRALDVLIEEQGPQAFEDLICFVVSAHEHWHADALRAATRAESLARSEQPVSPERLRLARLARGKVLRLMGREERAYADLDLRQPISASWAHSDGEVVARVRLKEEEPEEPSGLK